MDFLQLQLFDSVAQTLSLTKTADLFNITQPAVSHNLKKLEEFYGVKFFTRNSRGIKLTDAGKEFLPHAQDILETVDAAKLRMLNYSKGHSGRIRVAAVPSTMHHLAVSLDAIHTNNPDLQIDIGLYEGPELVNCMALKSYDFFFSTYSSQFSFSGYEYRIIADESLDLYVGNCNLDRINVDNWAQSLRDIPLVSVSMSNSTLAEPILNILKDYKSNSEFVNYYNRVESVLLAVSVGIGVAILPRGLADSYKCNDITTFPLEGGENCLKYAFLWNKDTINSPSNALFAKTVLGRYGLDSDF